MGTCHPEEGLLFSHRTCGASNVGVFMSVGLVNPLLRSRVLWLVVSRTFGSELRLGVAGPQHVYVFSLDHIDKLLFYA
jgi:hypothetical protein